MAAKKNQIIKKKPGAKPRTTKAKAAKASVKNTSEVQTNAKRKKAKAAPTAKPLASKKKKAAVKGEARPASEQVAPIIKQEPTQQQKIEDAAATGQRVLSTIEQCSRILKITSQYFYRLIKDGKLPPAVGKRGAANLWDTGQVVDAWVEFKAPANTSTKEDKEKLVREIDLARKYKLELEAQQIAVALDTQRGELVEIHDVVRIVTEQFHNIRSRLLVIPSKTASSIAALTGHPETTEIQEAIGSEIRDALLELSESEVIEDGGTDSRDS